MRKKGIIAAGAALILICVLAGIIYMKYRPETSDGEKEVSVTVIHSDKTEKEGLYSAQPYFMVFLQRGHDAS